MQFQGRVIKPIKIRFVSQRYYTCEGTIWGAGKNYEEILFDVGILEIIYIHLFNEIFVVILAR